MRECEDFESLLLYNYLLEVPTFSPHEYSASSFHSECIMITFHFITFFHEPKNINSTYMLFVQ